MVLKSRLFRRSVASCKHKQDKNTSLIVILIVEIVLCVGEVGFATQNEDGDSVLPTESPIRLRYIVRVGAPPPWDSDTDGDDPWGHDLIPCGRYTLIL